ncbi:hypothetical protein [Mycobacterium sp. 852002-51152_SCH6134967]|uniref:hypothetical protein n=1 Tax=Mycobacterium sp. 852002-51152_SCH6134967 TaxID=1834096 RepID=UPI000AEC322A|nr:hypothetical protein [Mycobacterium sp. 852002-51152_SCH6134967]
MGNYLALVLILILTLSPVLVPLIITGAHVIAELRRKPPAVRSAVIAQRRAPEVV